MTSPRTFIFNPAFALTLMLFGCGENGELGDVNAVSEGPSAKPAKTLHYDKSVREHACEAMPIELVARLFEIPVADIERGGGKHSCRYRRETDNHIFYAELTSIKVFDDVEKAKRRYADFTRDATQDDVNAQKEELDRAIENEEALETEIQKKTAGTIADLFAASTPEGGLKHETIEGLADEAKIDNENGTIRIRSGNMMFYVLAYNGPRQPLTGTSNMDEVMAEARAWNAKVLPDRASAATKLAREVVPLMEKLAN